MEENTNIKNTEAESGSGQTQISSEPAAIESNSKKQKSKWLFPALFIAAIVIGGSAAAYQAVFNKSPEELFASALSNTIDKLDEYTVQAEEYEGVKAEGGFELSSPLPVEGTVSAQFNGSNGVLNSEVTAAGLGIKNEIRSIETDSSEAPDIYVKFDGLESVGSLIGSFLPDEGAETAGFISQLDNQWYVFEGSLIEETLAEVDQSSDMSTMPELAPEEVEEIRTAVIATLRDRLFSTDEEKAVFEIREEIGEEEFVDTDTYKLKVGVDKENLIQFLEAFEPVVKDTPLNKLVEAAYPDQSIDEVIQFEDIRESIESSDFNFEDAAAEVWVAANGGFIRNVRFFPIDGNTDNYLDFMLPLENDNVLPLEIRATVDDEGSVGIVSFGIDITKEQSIARLWFDIDLSTSGTPIEVQAELTLEATNDPVDVKAPEESEIRQGTEVIEEILIGLNGPLRSSGSELPAELNGFSGGDDFELAPGEL